MVMLCTSMGLRLAAAASTSFATLISVGMLPSSICTSNSWGRRSLHALHSWNRSNAKRRRQKSLGKEKTPVDELRHKMRQMTSSKLRMNKLELEAALEKEAQLLHTSTTEEIELRGLGLFGLRVDRGYCRHVTDSSGQVEVRLLLDRSDSGFIRGFRPGKLVDVVLNDGHTDNELYRPPRQSSLENWRIVQGIISAVSDDHILVRVNSLANYLLDALIQSTDRAVDVSTNSVYLLKRSDAGIYNGAASALHMAMKYVDKLSDTEAVSGAKSVIIPSLYGTKLESQTDCVQPQQAHIFNPKLDEPKRAAVEKCSLCEPLNIVHGPPGTGKTTALAAVILSALANGDRVLAVAPSHAAVDALALAIEQHWPERVLGTLNKNLSSGPNHNDNYGDSATGLVRLGNELRLTVPSVKRFLPESIKTDSELSRLSQKLLQARQELLKQRRKRGEALKAEVELCQSLADRKRAVEDAVIKNAKVVLATNLTACKHRAIQHDLLTKKFDLVCMDEAAFSTDPLVIPLVLKAQRLVLSGDHFQLPPVILNEQNQEHAVSLMEKLAKNLPSAVTLLSTQYRSNQLISRWSSNYFYSGKVCAHPSVQDQRLADLPNVSSNTETNVPILFIDTSNGEYPEDVDPYNSDGDESIANFNEAFVIEMLIEKYVSLGVAPSDIGVIAPYWAQVSVLRSLIWSHKSLKSVEIRTVDGFQGREKELVLISFVRSNPERLIGFLEETRRINVSVTRAKRCCVAVGNAHTLSASAGLASLIRFCKNNRAFVSVENVL